MEVYRNTRLFSCQYRQSLALLVALGLISAAAAVSGTAQSLNTSPVCIENFGKVNERYYRGAQPTAVQFTELKRLGVKTIIDLRQDRISNASDWARDRGLQYINIPLTTKRAATPEETGYFLKLVRDPAYWPVYVHCKGGRHRTGEMTALYRITSEGWSADQAYEEIKKYVFSYYDQFAAKLNESR